MKQLFTILIAAVVFTACQKQQVIPQEQTITTLPDITGRWYYEDGRSFTIDSTTPTHAYITFNETIETPKNLGRIQLKYDLRYSNDTVYCTIPNIYPCSYFTHGGTRGYGVEYRKIPGQGDYLRLRRGKNVFL